MTSPIFHPLAEDELFEVMDWYEAKLQGLGDKFLGRVTEALDYIASYPESCPVLLGRARRKPLRQFPYSIVYSIDPRGIFILAVAHQMRRVDYWEDRL